jgi:NADH-ubiquinone oxidoreductase chain 3
MSSLLLLFIFVPVLTGILLALNLLLAVHRPDDSKVSAYECGFSPIYGQTRSPFHVQFYLVGILFLIFDLEILLIYPLAVTLYQVSTYGFWIAIIFFAILTVGFVLEIGTGVLYFTDQKTSLADLRPQDDLQTKNPSPLGNPLSQCIVLGLVLFSNPDCFDLVSSSLTETQTLICLSAPIISVESSKSYFELVSEKDKGQDTNNVYLLAKRHIASGAPTTAETINLVLSEFSITVSQDELDILIGIEKLEISLSTSKDSDSPVFVLSQSLSKLQPNESSNRLVGVYVLTNNVTGEQYVGSSINLVARINRYFSPSVLATEKRAITKSLVKHGIKNFSLEIYVIDPSLFEGKFTFRERDFSLALEQYFIFTKNPALNHIKVAGATPGGPMDENTKLSIKKANSKPLYVYNEDKTILLHISDSSAPILAEFNLCKHTLWKYITNGEALYGKLIFSKDLLSEATVRLTDIQELAQILAEGKLSLNLQNKPNQKISITLIDNETNKEYLFDSLRSASKFTKSFGPSNSRYIGKDKIIKMKSGEFYKGWVMRRD